MTIATVRLRNGSVVPTVAVAAYWISIKMLHEEGGSVVLGELRKKCQNPHHQIVNDTVRQELIDMAFMNEQEIVHDAVRNIVLSAVDENLRVQHPVNEE